MDTQFQFVEFPRDSFIWNTLGCFLVCLLIFCRNIILFQMEGVIDCVPYLKLINNFSQ